VSASGRLDVRVPIGALFLVLGVLIGGYGLATMGDGALYARSLSVNVNLWWGGVMVVCGAAFLALGLRARP
jgi:membrane protein implicated in regulation of membrane protease activity